MLSVGTNLTSQADTLQKVKVDYLYHSLRNPKPEISARITQLRIVRNIDSKRYALLKRQLPYVVCAMFNPPYRRTENFAYTEYFIVDIDHLYDKGMEPESVRQRLQTDERVVMCFLSPGEDGLKVLFRLSERCYDAGMYSIFYKTFVKAISTQYGLDQVIDERTSDVCRACFISMDRNAYYNPEAVAINMDTYIDKNNINALFEMKASQTKEIKEALKAEKEETETHNVDPDEEVMARVKALLNPKSRAVQKPEPYVPERLEEIMEELKTYVENTGVILYEVTSIQYGKKLRFKMGLKLAEINLFYGKRGFSVVQSPRCGVSAELNELMAQLVENFVYGIVEYGG